METQAQEELKAHLMATDEHFREMCRQHSEYDRKIQEFEAKHALSEQEQLEEVRLKKVKLHLKDQIAELMSKYKSQHVS